MPPRAPMICEHAGVAIQGWIMCHCFFADGPYDEGMKWRGKIIMFVLVAGVVAGALWYVMPSLLSPHTFTASVAPVSGSGEYIARAATTTAAVMSYCAPDAAFASPQDERLCTQEPLLNRFRLFQIDLTDSRILFYENGMLQETFPIAYQSAYDRWFKTPTGYFQFGVKHPKFMSSIVPVYMEDAVQLYEDFFIHNIPYYADGTKVTSQFSGGCIRLQDDVAKKFYATAQTGDAVVSYATLHNLVPKEGFASPVELSQYWVRQRFNSPLKTVWAWHQDTSENYIQHTGVDLAPQPGATDLHAHAVYDGVVAKITHNGQGDGGLGNSVIIRHVINGETLYSLYGHLASIDVAMTPDALVHAGDVVGVIGNTGYGCNYWHVGKDGCDETSEPDTHLHLEIKTAPVLQAPLHNICTLPSGKVTECIGYTSDDPTKFGYKDPLLTIFNAVPTSSPAASAL